MTPWSGWERHASEQLPRVRSSASDTRCARSCRSRTAVLRTTRQARLSLSSLSPSLSASSASEALRAPISLCHCHPPSRHLRPVLPRYSSRLCSPPGLAICLSSRHTPNYSTPMEIQVAMTPSPCRSTHPLRARWRRHRMLATDLREFVSPPESCIPESLHSLTSSRDIVISASLLPHP
jgi:hypothetical protein